MGRGVDPELRFRAIREQVGGDRFPFFSTSNLYPPLLIPPTDSSVSTMPDEISVLFVCLGNICRSTMAEGVFQSMAKKEPYMNLVAKVDSCGTGKHPNVVHLLNLMIPNSFFQAPTTSAKNPTTGQCPRWRSMASRTTCMRRGRYIELGSRNRFDGNLIS
jgi:hypothetical protein